MASKLRSYEFTGRTYTKYPWEKWLEGIWQIEQGTDYTVGDPSMMSSLRAKAARMNMRVQINIPKEGVIVFQFMPRSDNGA